MIILPLVFIVAVIAAMNALASVGWRNALIVFSSVFGIFVLTVLWSYSFLMLTQ